MSTANLPGAAGLTQALTPALTRAPRSGPWGRIEGWFRRATDLGRAKSFDRADRQAAAGAAADGAAGPAIDSPDSMAGFPAAEAFRPRARFSRRRPRRRSDDVQEVQDAAGALAELVADLREGMARQSARQEELLAPISRLPDVLGESMRDSLGQSMGQSLGAIREVQGQVERQGAQQWQIAEILERISRADAEQGRVLDALCRHESSFSDNLARVDENLSRVGEAMQGVGATSEAGARALERLCDGILVRDAELGRALKGQNRRLTALLSISIGLSVVAIAWATVVAAAGLAAFLYMHRAGLR